MVETNKEKIEKPPGLGGGPLGLGDPDDRRLRKTERDILIPKLMKEEASKRCIEPFKVFLNCAKEAGVLFTFKCQAENDANNKCLESWLKNPEFVREMTEKYLENRSHFRRTGEPLIKYDRKKKLEVN